MSALGASPAPPAASAPAEPPLAQPQAPIPPGPVLVWTGRTPQLWPGGRDGWNTSRKQFLAALDRAEIVAMVDPVSVPWPMMGARPDVPLVVVLPQTLDAGTVSSLLGQVLFSLLTPFDRLIHGSAEVRRALSETWDLPESVWLPWDGEGDGWRPVLEALLADTAATEELSHGKARWVQPRLLAAEAVGLALSVGPSDAGVMSEPTTTEENGATGPTVVRAPERRRRVALAGDVDGWASLLAHFVQGEVNHLEEIVAPAPGAFPLPAPDGVVLVLRDGDQSAAERLALLRQAHDVLRPGAALVVVAHVVDTADGRPNPSIHTLIEEIHEATGTSIHLHDLTSARWAGDRLTRGVVLALTSLRLREV